MNDSGAAPGEEPIPLVPTGQLLVVLNDEAPRAETLTRLSAHCGGLVRGSTARTAGRSSGRSDRAAGVVLERLGVGVLHPVGDVSSQGLLERLSDDESVSFVRPEYVMAVAGADAGEDWVERYRRWLRDGAALLAERPDLFDVPLPDNGTDERPEPPVGRPSEPNVTWGVAATGAHTSNLTGRGVRIGIVDTGISPVHPDISGRRMTGRSFVPYEDVTDRNGHGTHVFGIACGRSTGSGPRYGVAPDADPVVAKVLDGLGTGYESWVLAGLEWAIEEGCDIVTLSLGRPADGAGLDEVYERVGNVALEHGTLVLAASGNSSDRPRVVRPVFSPGSAESILAVGAVAEDLSVAPFSNGRAAGSSPSVDVVGPGVRIHSSFPPPLLYRSLSGTSMSTPSAAGVAALYAESDAALRGRALWDELVAEALALDASPDDVGRGLVQAPS